jgi:hypothetical protein
VFLDLPFHRRANKDENGGGTSGHPASNRHVGANGVVVVAMFPGHSPKEISSGAFLSIGIYKGELLLGLLKYPILISTCITFCIHFGIMGIGWLWLNDGQMANEI